LARLLAGSVAEAVARNLKVPTLLLPIGGPAFVNADTGALQLSRVLVLGGSLPDAQLGLDASAWLLRAVGETASQITLLHVEDGKPAPSVVIPNGMQVQTELRSGPFEQAVLTLARAWEPNLVVMVSHGHDGILDVLVSNHTERVLHDALRPLLWVPPEWKGSL
jgi:nucleotide-binding universal stress UspA family protein